MFLGREGKGREWKRRVRRGREGKEREVFVSPGVAEAASGVQMVEADAEGEGSYVSPQHLFLKDGCDEEQRSTPLTPFHLSRGRLEG